MSEFLSPFLVASPEQLGPRSGTMDRKAGDLVAGDSVRQTEQIEIVLTEEQALAIERIARDGSASPRCVPKLLPMYPLDDVGE